MVKARKYVVVKKFQGLPKRSDFEVVEEELPAPKNGEILVKAEYISVDPYMRGYAPGMTIPYDQFAYQVAKVLESKNPKYPVGSRVVAHLGWRDYTVFDPALDIPVGGVPYALPKLGSLSASHGVGAVGMPGATAYFGFLNVCQPKAGETVVVTGAAGAVGSLVGQIAKIKGCKTIGFAGSDEKVKVLKEEYGFDHAINYKTADIAKALKEAAPEGVDCFFDNVGGEISNIVMSQMNRFGRMAICGAISTYNDEPTKGPKGLLDHYVILSKQLKVQAFNVWQWAQDLPTAIKDLSQWIHEGKLKAKEHMTEGFDHLYDALVGMLQGENIGKSVVKV